MQIFEVIDGKKYVVYNKVLLIMIISLFWFLGIMTYGVHYAIAYHDRIANNPLIEGAKTYDISMCTCQLGNGAEVKYNQTTIWKETKSDSGIKEVFNITAIEMTN